MRARTRLLIVLLASGALLFATGTGAFSTVMAERTVSVSVSDDGSALLKLQPHTGPNGAYAETNAGELAVNFDDLNGDGVNLNATTTLGDVFNVTNQGTQTVDVYVTKSGANAGLVTFENASGKRIDGGSGNAVSAPVGETVEVTIKIDTTGQNLASGTSLLDSITIYAEKTDSGSDVPGGGLPSGP